MGAAKLVQIVVMGRDGSEVTDDHAGEGFHRIVPTMALSATHGRTPDPGVLAVQTSTLFPSSRQLVLMLEDLPDQVVAGGVVQIKHAPRQSDGPAVAIPSPQLCTLTPGL